MNTRPETLQGQTPPLEPGKQAAARGSAPDRSETAAPAHLSRSVRRLLAVIVLVAAFAELAYAVVNVSAMPVFIVDNAHLDVRWVGIIGTAYLLVEGVLKSPMGVLGDHIGRKTLIMAGPIVSTFTAAFTPLVHNPYALMGLRVLDGMGAAALWPSAFSLIGDFVPEEKRATGMSLFNVAYIFGIAFGPALGGNINHWAYKFLSHPITTHFRSAAGSRINHWVRASLHHAFVHSKDFSFYVAAILFAATVVLAAVFIPNARPNPKAETAHTGEGGFSFADFKRMLARMPMTLLITFIIFLGIGFVMLYVKVYALDRQGPFHMSERTFGNALIVPALLIGALSVPCGTIGDRIGKIKAVRIGIGLCAASFWLLLFFPSQLTLMALGTLIGLGFVIAFPAWMALVSAMCGNTQRGAAVGAVGTAQGLGAIVGAAASGFLYKLPTLRLGPIPLPPHSVPFLGCAVMLLVAFILVLMHINETQSSPA